MQHHLASPQLVFTPQLIPASMWRRRTAHQPMLACAHGTVKSPHVTWAPEAPQQHGADAQCKPALCWECVLHRTESASGHGWESRASFPLSDPGGLTSPQSLWEMIWWLPCLVCTYLSLPLPWGLTQPSSPMAHPSHKLARCTPKGTCSHVHNAAHTETHVCAHRCHTRACAYEHVCARDHLSSHLPQHAQ